MNADYHSTLSHDQRIASYLPPGAIRTYYWHYRQSGLEPREAVTAAIEDHTFDKPFADQWR